MKSRLNQYLEAVQSNEKQIQAYLKSNSKKSVDVISDRGGLDEMSKKISGAEFGRRLCSVFNDEVSIDEAIKNDNWDRIVYVFGNGKRFAIAKNTGAYSSTFKLYSSFEDMAKDPYF